MKAGRNWVVAAMALLIAPLPSGAGAPAPPKAGSPETIAAADGGLRVKNVVLGIRHRAIHDFYEETSVALDQEFPVGDTDYKAKILRFVADFSMDEKRRIFSRSPRPANPALQIATWQGGSPHDTSWAFLNFPPHFSKRSLLAFQVLRIEFQNHAPITPKQLVIDTTAAGGRKR